MLSDPLRTASTLVVLALAASMPAAPGELEEREAPLYAAALLYVAQSDLCSAKKPCCYSVGEAVPNSELVKVLRGKKELTPLESGGSCAGLTLDAWRLSQTADEQQKVWVGVGGPGITLISCIHVLNLTTEGWVVDPSKDSCPVV